jgi:nucleoside-diphosphate-sugar epimerase
VKLVNPPMNGLSMNRIVVIGKAGFVGSRLLSELRDSDFSHIGIGREDIDLVGLDSIDYLSKFLKNDDIVCFAAGDVPVKTIEQFQANLLMLSNFLEATKGLELSQVVYISSDAVYGDSDKPLKESDLPTPNSLHGVMHLTREIILKESKFRSQLCIARPTLIYGSNEPHGGYGPTLMTRTAIFSNFIKIFGGGEELRDFIHIDDVGNILKKLIMLNFTGTINIATGDLTSFSSIANEILRISRDPIELISVPRNGPMPHNGFRPICVDKMRLLIPDLAITRIEKGLETMFQELSKSPEL